MGVSLAKGGNVSLTKEAPGLTSVLVGLGWDVRTTTGADYDLDASAIMLNANGKVLSDQHFIFQTSMMITAPSTMRPKSSAPRLIRFALMWK